MPTDPNRPGLSAALAVAHSTLHQLLRQVAEADRLRAAGNDAQLLQALRLMHTGAWDLTALLHKWLIALRDRPTVLRP
jgi:hypothetical protein